MAKLRKVASLFLFFYASSKKMHHQPAVIKMKFQNTVATETSSSLLLAAFTICASPWFYFEESTPQTFASNNSTAGRQADAG